MVNEMEDLINKLFEESGLPLSEKNRFRNEFINDLNSISISANESGYKDSDFQIDLNVLSSTLYDLYLEVQQECKERLTPTLREDDLDDSHNWASTGDMNGFQWVALTNYYNPSVHKLNNDKNTANDYFRKVVRGEKLEDMLVDAINNSSFIPHLFHIIHNNPLILNLSDAGYEYKYVRGDQFNESQISLEYYTRSLFGSNNQPDIIMDGDKSTINNNLIKGRNVLFVSPVLDQGDTFKDIGQLLLRNGAATVFGIFIARLKPTVSGIYPSDIGDEYIRPLYPRISFNLGAFFDSL